MDISTHKGTAIQQCSGLQLLNDCLMCKLISKSEENPLFIVRLEHGSVFLHKNQSYLGRCIFIFNQHYDNIADVEKYIFMNASAELQKVCGIVSSVFDSDLINIAMLGNQQRHLHWHIIPRYKDDHNWGKPPWPSQSLLLDSQKYLILVETLRKSLFWRIK